MVCKQCKKNKVDKLIKIKICNACYSKNYRKLHPEKYNYQLSGNKWKALKRDNYRCTICGDKNKLVVHRLDGNGASKNGKILREKEQNNNLDNLQTVCCKCHRKLHKPYRVKSEKWANKFNRCIKCGTNSTPHCGKGLCIKCYEKLSYKRNEKQVKKRKAEWYQKRGKYLRKIKKINDK